MTLFSRTNTTDIGRITRIYDADGHEIENLVWCDTDFGIGLVKGRGPFGVPREYRIEIKTPIKVVYEWVQPVPKPGIGPRPVDSLTIKLELPDRTRNDMKSAIRQFSESMARISKNITHAFALPRGFFK